MKTEATMQEAWLAGFWAASLLFSGRYDDYAKERDKMLEEKKCQKKQ